MTITLDQPQKQLSESLWDLKETAKWARHPGEKQAAIRTLSARGEEALTSLEEILAVTAYADIRSTCEEAIRSVREKNLSSSSSSAIANEKNNNNNSSSSSGATAEKPKKNADANRAEDSKSKEAATGKSSKADNNNNGGNGSSSTLADLPP